MNREYQDIVIVDSNGVIKYILAANIALPMAPEQLINKSVLEIYTNLNTTNSTLMKAVRAGESTLDYEQELVTNNIKLNQISSTYPIMDGTRIIGAIEFSRLIYPAESIEQIRNHRDRSVYRKNNTQYIIDDIISRDPEIEKIKAIMRKVSKTDSTVLITGETGTGKELVAQSIHNLSKRMNKPFVSQNCGAIPEKLLESLLFGTVKGAFTGAENMVGLLESAAGGTVFLDEINSLPLELQMKLLKVLEERKFRRLGGTEEIYTDTRFIAAANQDVQKLARNGLFRPDLYYRISAMSVELPRLSARYGDIELLANHFINYYNFKMRKNIEHIPASILSIFKGYAWPGNVRELRNVIERIFNLSENGEITQDYLPNEMRFPETCYSNSIETRFGFDGVPWNKATETTNLKQMVKEYEYALICHTYQKHNENLSKTAEALQISRQLLKYKMDRE